MDSEHPATSPQGWAGQRSSQRKLRARALLGIVLVIATAGLVYELVIAAAASYLLGDSIRQFSLVIGVYLSALGLGAFLSRSLDKDLETVFVDVELAAAVAGGVSAPVLWLTFGHTDAFQLVLYGFVVLVGTLVGLELPLLIRILRQELEFKELIAQALTFDYLGALIGSLAFSFVMVPTLGLLRTSLVCGLLNAGVALASTWLLVKADGSNRKALRACRWRGAFVCVGLMVGVASAERLTQYGEEQLHGGAISTALHSEYQRIVLMRQADGFSLYLNGNLQFSSVDEASYHEALVHPAMAIVARPESVMIGGGGDGLAAREILKWPGVKQVSLVDIDRAVTELARENPELQRLNGRALHDPRVQIENQDAMTYLGVSLETFDVMVLDFPDPSNYSLGKLYSSAFYRRAAQRLAPGGALVVQATSPLFARRSFWCIVTTLKEAGFVVQPYHLNIPSFGEWGFVLATKSARELPTQFPLLDAAGTTPTTLTSGRLARMFGFPSDMRELDVQANHLNNQVLVAYYLDEWSRFN